MLRVAEQGIACSDLRDGIYALDEDADTEFDGGRLERIVAKVEGQRTQPRYRGTTFQIGVSYVVGEGGVTLFRTMSNGADDKFEQLSIVVPVSKKVDCDGNLKFEFEVLEYYGNDVKIGAKPTKRAQRLSTPLKIQMSGHIMKNGDLRLLHCEAFKARGTGWRSTEDDLGLCGGVGSKVTLFNISAQVAGRAGWLEPATINQKAR